MEAPSIDLIEMMIRICLAAALGAGVGLEREWRDRAAGLRTHMLVCLGAAIFTMISAYGFTEWMNVALSRPSGPPTFVSDPGRIAAQIVSGIGFLGAGAIWRNGGSVSGLTTAATLWIMAAIGMAVGIGQYELAAFSTFVILFVLMVLRLVGKRVREHTGREKLHVEMRIKKEVNVAEIVAVAKAKNGDVSQMQLGSESRDGGRMLEFKVSYHGGVEEAELLDSLADMDGVFTVRISSDD